MSKADQIEQNVRRDIERTRERAIDQAAAIRDRMARLVKQLEEVGLDEFPPAGTGVLQDAAELERHLAEWVEKRGTLRILHGMRQALGEPAKPGNNGA
jgi:hypothetical protein